MKNTYYRRAQLDYLIALLKAIRDRPSISYIEVNRRYTLIKSLVRRFFKYEKEELI